MRPFGEGSGGALRLFAAVAAAYAATAFLSWQFFEVGLNPKFYVPAGITLAAMLLTPRRRWPLIVAAIAVAEISVDMYFGTSLPVAIGFVAANSLEPIVGASLVLAWCGGSPDLRRRADLAKFVVAGCTAGPLVGGLIGGSLSAIGSGHPWWSDVIQWWVGDGIGALVIASPILLWAKQSHVIRSRPIETALVLVATVAVSVTAFWAETPPTLLLLPLMAWAAFRLDVLGAALAGSTLALAANYMTLTGHGPFAEYSSEPVLRQAATQIFIAVIVLVAMLTAQEVAGRLAAVRAHESERRERLRLENLSRLAQQLSAALTPRDIGRALEEQVLNEAGASALGLGLVNADLNRLEWVITPGYSSEVIAEVQGGLPLSDSNVTTDAVRSGRPVIIADAAEYALRYPANLRWLEISGAESIVGWPLTSGGESIGTLLLAWSEPQKLDAAQLAFISAVATMVGQALVRARVYADEHARAAVMQSALVPSCPTAVSGIEVCVSYQPADVAHGLGGDWYDVMALPGGCVYLAVGDVVGHGLPAVEDMAQLRSAARALAHQGLAPVGLLTELNSFTRDASQGRFATMAVAFFNPASRSLCYGSAGHPPVVLRRARTGEVMRLSDACGPVLGPVPGARYAEGRVDLEPGDLVVMYTDGLVERRGTDIEIGIADVERLARGWAEGTPLAQACSELAALAARPRNDDVCVLAARFGPVSPEPTAAD